MKTDATPPEDLPDDTLPRDLLDALRALPSEQAQPSPATDAAIMAEARETLAKIRHRKRHIPFWPLLAVAACIALAFTLITRPDIPTVAAAPPPTEDKYALILREVTSVFPDQVKAIIADGGELRISLSDQPISDTQQAVVVELCENRKCTTVITYVGQTVEVGGHIVTIRTDENGAIVVDTPDNREPDDPSTNPESDLQIHTRRI